MSTSCSCCRAIFFTKTEFELRLFGSRTFLILAYFILATVPCIHCANILASCRCVHFHSPGTFYSPNYPSINSTSRRCLIYKFTAPPNSIVIATFDAFNIAPQSKRIYDETSDGLINENARYVGEYCGNQILPETSFSSLHNHLLFHMSLRQPSEGFKGTFTFISKKNFQSNAVHKGKCNYSVNVLEGKIFSPQYPHYYPPDSHCFYEFPSRASRELLLTLEFLELSSEDCSHNYIEVYKLAPKSRGFKFIFKYLPFRDDSLDGAAPSQQQSLQNVNSSSGCGLEVKSPSITSTPNGSKLATGIISSKSYIQPQNGVQKCRFFFRGSAEEQIQITFRYFNLNPAEINDDAEERRCEYADKVSISIGIGKKTVSIGDFCGSRLPPRVMSPKNYLELVYKVHSSLASQNYSSNATYGFTLQYNFRTDLGLAEMNAERNTSEECHFIFRSSRQKLGFIQSPNYPGLYPRMLNCLYVFYGLDNEFVLVTFEAFDVQGLPECEDVSSGYVLFSNYQSDDRTNRKFCGQLKPTQPIRSESNYFRMAFRSSYMFDGTGFYAQYQFLNSETTEFNSEKAPSKASRQIVAHADRSIKDLLSTLLPYTSFLICRLFVNQVV